MSDEDMVVFDDGSAVVSFNCEGTNEEDCFGAREASTGALDSGVPALQSIENTKDIFVALVGSSGSFKLLLSAGSNESDYAQAVATLADGGMLVAGYFCHRAGIQQTGECTVTFD